MAAKLGIAAVLLAALGAFFAFTKSGTMVIQPATGRVQSTASSSPTGTIPTPGSASVTSTPTSTPVVAKRGDIEKQQPLPNPPVVVKAIYATNWSAGSPAKVAYFIKFIKANGLNAIVIDIKDYSGYIGYDTDVADVEKYKAEEVRIGAINKLIKRLHDEGIYVIGRVAVFQDQRFIAAHPEFAVQSKTTGKTWRDRKGLGWADPASKEAWDYNIAIARDAFDRGFDEINFDYIRFPSDGNMEDMLFPVWQEKRTRVAVLEDFFSYLRNELRGKTISADIFGLASVNTDDLGIGQKLENILPYFDYVAPMVYPSHYATGFLGYKNPAQYPYEVVKYSIEHATARIEKLRTPVNASTTTSTVPRVPDRPLGRIRPWLQVFDLGATYDADKVRAQIRASDEAGGVGYMLWAPSNVYVNYAGR